MYSLCLSERDDYPKDKTEQGPDETATRNILVKSRGYGSAQYAADAGTPIARCKQIQMFRQEANGACRQRQRDEIVEAHTSLSDGCTANGTTCTAVRPWLRPFGWLSGR